MTSRSRSPHRRSRASTPSLELAGKFAAHGYPVVPHLSARLVADRSHLEELVARFKEMGVKDVFVVAGDAEQPAGAYEGAGRLLEDCRRSAILRADRDHGVPGEPSADRRRDDDRRHVREVAVRHVHRKPDLLRLPGHVGWVNNVWARGTKLPILVGIPGVVPRAKLLRVSTRIGIGESMRYLRKHHDFVTRFFRPGGFSPDNLIKGLAPVIEDPEQKIAGFHIFTFNDLADTEAWRQKKLAGR